jgi:osmotically-inducible protein OsmY
MSGQRAGQAVGWISTEDVDRVKAAIRDRIGSRVSEVRVTVREGELILLGRCRTHHAKQLAQQAALKFADWPVLANDIQVRGEDTEGGDRGSDIKAAGD